MIRVCKRAILAVALAVLPAATAMSAAAAAVARPEPARVVAAVEARIASLDPFSLTGIDTYQATANVLEPLARRHPLSGELIPVLAESWTLDPARKTFRVKLKKDVKFQNGQVLSAEDVRFTFDAYFKPEYKGGVWRAMWQDIDSVRVIDPLTVEFKMKRWRYSGFLNALTTLRILPRSFYSPYDAEKFRGHIVGTGPFQLERFEPNRSLELKPNPTWWGGSSPDFHLLLKSVGDAGLARQMILKSELDFYALHSGADATEAASKAEEKKGLRVLRSPAAQGEGLWIDLNLKRSLFKDPDVREALLILWDRGRLNQAVFGGRYRLALDNFSPKMSFYPAGTPEPHDLKKAVRLLRGRKLKFTILAHSARAERWLGLYQSDAAKAGVEVRIKRLEEDSQWWKALKDGKFDAVAGEGGVSSGLEESTWRSDGYYNFSGYSNKEIDAGIDRLEREFDLQKRHALQRHLIEKLRADHPQLPGLYSPEEIYFLSARLRVDSRFPTHAWLWRLKN